MKQEPREDPRESGRERREERRYKAREDAREPREPSRGLSDRYLKREPRDVVDVSSSSASHSPSRDRGRREDLPSFSRDRDLPDAPRDYGRDRPGGVKRGRGFDEQARGSSERRSYARGADDSLWDRSTDAPPSSGSRRMRGFDDPFEVRSSSSDSDRRRPSAAPPIAMKREPEGGRGHTPPPVRIKSEPGYSRQPVAGTNPLKKVWTRHWT